MEPQTAVHVPDPTARALLTDRLGRLTDTAGQPLFEVRAVGPTLSLTLRVSQDLFDDGLVRLPDGSTLPTHDAGLEDIEAETPGTAYHIPEGIWLARGPGVGADPGRRAASALDHAPTVLGRLGVDVPAHMTGQDLLRAAEPAATRRPKPIASNTQR